MREVFPQKTQKSRENEKVESLFAIFDQKRSDNGSGCNLTKFQSLNNFQTEKNRLKKQIHSFS